MRKLKVYGFAIVVGCLISIQAVNAGSRVPPILFRFGCGATSGNPDCGANGSCTTSTSCNGTQAPDLFGYCCKENLTSCTQYTGVFECCNNAWHSLCTAAAPMAGGNCGTDSHCF